MADHSCGSGGTLGAPLGFQLNQFVCRHEATCRSSKPQSDCEALCREARTEANSDRIVQFKSWIHRGYITFILVTPFHMPGKPRVRKSGKFNQKVTVSSVAQQTFFTPRNTLTVMHI